MVLRSPSMAQWCTDSITEGSEGSEGDEGGDEGFFQRQVLKFYGKVR